MSRDPLLFLEDIEKASRRIVRYTAGRERDSVVVPSLLPKLQRIAQEEKRRARPPS